MTKLIKTIHEWRAIRRTIIFANKILGFVPTMGNLHAGHQSLLTRSVAENDLTLLSLFVNPTQFDNPDDLTKYPKTLEQDLRMAETTKVDFVLLPDYNELYPDNYRYSVQENQFSTTLCGKHRPGHFNGVLTVVMKLLQLAQAKHAYFGEKDFQQLQLVKGMVDAFFLDTEIVACPIIRDAHGLALSSRNSRLNPQQYQLAVKFAELLRSKSSCAVIIAELKKLDIAVDYIEEQEGRRFGAVKIDDIRLIDNVCMEIKL